MIGHNNIVVDKEIIEKVMEDSGASKFEVIQGCNMKPLYNQIVLLMDKKKEPVSKGGIILDETTEPTCSVGTVLAVGDGVYNSSGELLPMTVKRFDRVRAKENFAETMTYQGTEYHVIRETDLMVILPKI